MKEWLFHSLLNCSIVQTLRRLMEQLRVHLHLVCLTEFFTNTFTMMSEPMLLKPKLIDAPFLCVVLAALISSGQASADGGKGVLATVLEASGQGCPGLPPIVSSNNRLYVAPNGNDAASGAQDAPLATLGKAASLLPNGGTVIVRGGVYPAQPMFDAVGSKDVPLHIRAADGEKPIFDGSDMQDVYSAVINASPPWLKGNICGKLLI